MTRFFNGNTVSQLQRGVYVAEGPVDASEVVSVPASLPTDAIATELDTLLSKDGYGLSEGRRATVTSDYDGKEKVRGYWVVRNGGFSIVKTIR